MFELLRRVLWYGPAFGLVATLWFVVLGKTLAPVEPTFALAFERNPRTLVRVAEDARRSLAAGAADAEARLTALGGAALPHHLRALPGLPLAEQDRLAAALLPVLTRMGVTEDFASPVVRASADDLPTDPRLSLRRFEEDHLSEFREALVERIVRRVATAESRARLADLELVDTFALPFLVKALGRVSSGEDVARVQRLSTAIARLLPGCRVAPPGATVEEARLVATEIRRLWDYRSADFADADPMTRIGLPLAQTEFAVWLRRVYREVGREDAPLLLGPLVASVRKSAPLVLAFLIGAILLAPILAALARLFELNRTRTLRLVPGTRYLLAATAVGALALVVRPPPGLGPLLGTVTLLGALPAAFVLDRDLNDRIDHRMRHVLASRAFSRRLVAIARLLGPSLPTLVPLLIAEAFVTISLVEFRAGREGLGLATLDALRSADANFLFGVSVTLSLSTTLAHLLADAALSPFEVIRRAR